jgi:hypothetical protein
VTFSIYAHGKSTHALVAVAGHDLHPVRRHLDVLSLENVSTLPLTKLISVSMRSPPRPSRPETLFSVTHAPRSCPPSKVG